MGGKRLHNELIFLNNASLTLLNAILAQLRHFFSLDISVFTRIV